MNDQLKFETQSFPILNPHPAAVFLRACPNARKLTLTCELCGHEFDVPADYRNEPWIEVCTIDVLNCPKCGKRKLAFPKE